MKASPPVALQPHQFHPSFPPTPQAPIRSTSPAVPGVHKGRPTSASKRTTKPAGAHPSAPPVATGVPNTNAGNVYETYIQNLKEQIQILELELKYVRDNADKQFEARKVAETLVPTRLSASINTLHASAEEIQRCDRIDAEIRELKAHYARREVEHTNEVAHLQQQLKDAVDAAKNAQAAVSHKFSIELDARVNAVELHYNTQKQSLVHENVKLQKTLERVMLESKTRDIELVNALRTKETLLKDLLDTKEINRNQNGKLEVITKQFEESQNQVRSTQEQIRLYEAKERDLRSQLALNQTDQESRWISRVSKLEDQVKQLTHELTEKTLACERAELVAKQADLRVAAHVDNATENSQLIDRLRQQIADQNSKMDQLNHSMKDICAERDYFKLQTEQQQTDMSLLNVKISQLQKQLADEGQIRANVERQHRSTIAELEALRRELSSRERTYKEMEQHDEDIRRQLRVMEIENGSLKEENNQLRAHHDSMRLQIGEQQRSIDSLKGEQNVAEVVKRLDQTKTELHTLLNTQLHLNNDVTSLVCQLHTPPMTIMPPMTAAITHNTDTTIMSIDHTNMSPGRTPLATGGAAAANVTGSLDAVTIGDNDVLKEIAELQAKIKEAESAIASMPTT
eukprot:PhF_6_TR19980/c0_g1_i1/m.29145